MTATERMSILLDERGVEYRREGCEFFFGDYHIWAMSDSVLCMSRTNLTPEQAIAATLGAGTLTAKQVMAIAGRHQPDYCSDTHVCFDWQAIADELNATLGSCNCSNDCTNGERTDAPSLPHFWTHDGTLHVELPKLPDSISVRLPDVRDREVHSARTWLYTLGAGTCHVECFDDGVDEGVDGEWYSYSAPTWYLSCGHEIHESERPEWCPWCGKKVVDE